MCRDDPAAPRSAATSASSSTRSGRSSRTSRALSWGPLLLALLCFAGYLTLRSRALFNAVQAAYPTEHVRWRDVWGAYVAGVGINQVFPLGGGTLVQYFLTRISIPGVELPGDHRRDLDRSSCSTGA